MGYLFVINHHLLVLADFNIQQDINKDNPLGMGGKLAISFANLMKLLWSGTIPSHAPTKLKSMMSMKANQFSGFAQHDAQEFMVELLDGLHEVNCCLLKVKLLIT